MEVLETYDPLADKPTMIIYLAEAGEKWIKLEGDRLVDGVLTRVLRTSYNYRPVSQRQIKVGERLKCHLEKPGQTMQVYRVIPTEWVVIKVERYEAILEDIPEFRDIAIAYCQRQPLSDEETQAMSSEIKPQVSLDSFGGDEEAYRQFLESDEANLLQIVNPAVSCNE